jgi:LytS/YehU family sensor histidine kinase
MIIHTFTENAVKHGLANKSKDKRGKIKVSIEKQDNNIQIEITDNGIGRQKAAEVSKDSTGKGLEIIDHIITLYNRLKKTNVSYEVVDLMENGKPAGTKIMIRVKQSHEQVLGAWQD